MLLYVFHHKIALAPKFNMKWKWGADIQKKSRPPPYLEKTGSSTV